MYAPPRRSFRALPSAPYRSQVFPSENGIVARSSMTPLILLFFFFFSSRRRHTRSDRDWSSDVCSSDLRKIFNFSYPQDQFTGCLVPSLIPAFKGDSTSAYARFAPTAFCLPRQFREIGRASCRERV